MGLFIKRSESARFQLTRCDDEVSWNEEDRHLKRQSQREIFFNELAFKR